MQLNFPTLKATDIDVRVGSCTEKGVSLLLYKNARVDMQMLDDVVGAMNWTRSHSRENANCTVSIWDEDKKLWISKEDTGTESNTEAEKGLASDSFKRACFNWGIGRELYTAGFTWVPKANLNNHYEQQGKWKCQDRFEVTKIEYDENRRIVGLEIKNSKGICYQMISPNTAASNIKNSDAKKEVAEQPKKSSAQIAKINIIKRMLGQHNLTSGSLFKKFKVNGWDDITEDLADHIIKSMTEYYGVSLDEN